MNDFKRFKGLRQDQIDQIVKLTKNLEAEKKNENPDQDYIKYLEEELGKLQ